jgi:hypothetical protein
MKFAYAATAAALLSALVGIAYGAWQLAGDDDDEPPPQTLAEGEWNPLLVDERTRLSICVDGVNGMPASNAQRAFVREIVDDAIANATLRVPASYEAWDLVRGCPDPTLDISLTREQDQPADWGRVLDVASQHRVFVYFLPGDAYEAAFGDEPYYASVEEVLCDGDVCEQVTRGLYLPSAADEEAAREAMSLLLHLVPPPTPPATNHKGDATEPADGP